MTPRTEAENSCYRDVRSILGFVQNGICTWQWWICIVFSILPWWLWWKYRDKFYWKEQLYTGAIITIISCVLDAVGYSIGYWSYNVLILPLPIGIFPYDATLIPVIITTIIRWRPNHFKVTKGILFSLITTFIGHPIFDSWLHFVNHYWNNSNSLPIYFVFIIVADRIYHKLICRREAISYS
ncbi:CBO0543 family protein [Paenibacillus allorhizoplanae]|uniref:CBO0543 family protein n=1 Tax=Paenibacillus allorhizoplanae TaxID=2905648 RepID=UPI003B8476DB